MVDFPEGYGFAAGQKARVMQDKFAAVVGVFTPVESHFPYNKRRSRSPYTFKEIGAVQKEAGNPTIRGILLSKDDTPVIEGTLQQVVTALCTLHRINGGK